MEPDLLKQSDYNAVFEASPDAMLVVDRAGVIRDLNRQAVMMFGWSREEIEGSPVERLVPAASRDLHRGHRRRYAEAPRARPMGRGLELEALHKDGTTIPVEISLAPSNLAAGRGHVICAVRDISAWRRMRKLSRMLVAAAENERKHLSHELHDEFLQTLVALKIRVKLLADERDDGERELARERIAEEIADAIAGVKRMIRGLLPPILEPSGLAAALRSMFRDVEEVYGFRIDGELERVEDELDAVATLALYRIVQEAVTNAVKHSGAGEAVVTLRTTNGRVSATICDEGRGFEWPDGEAMNKDGHIGLTGMHERAALVGGTLTVRSAPGEGATIRASVPVSEPDTDGAPGIQR
ncbi:MAG: PAS domain S-box protein [Gemmatimonadales bacterium]|nr:PAS domain S-box protein [Candidatus Palauibacter denitrificans]MYE68884.1 PAS domain S-box protein [Gemmatimonadota bacterium]